MKKQAAQNPAQPPVTGSGVVSLWLTLLLLILLALLLLLVATTLSGPGYWLVIGVIGAALAAGAGLAVRLVWLRRGLDRLAVQLDWMARHPGLDLPRPLAGPVAGLPLSARLIEYQQAVKVKRAAPDLRLARILDDLPEALILLADNGRILLVNAVARRLFGDQPLAAGSSVFDVLPRALMNRAFADLEAGAASVRLTEETPASAPLWLSALGDGTALLSLRPGGGDLSHLAVDITAHQQPPEPVTPTLQTPLDQLHLLVLDLETTGLDPQRARIVGVGGVRMIGGRIFDRAAVDWLVNPGRPIPAASTAIHGITNRMVAEAPQFPEVLHHLTELLGPCVLAGYNIGYDLAVLTQEGQRHHCPLPPAPWLLDARLLAAALNIPGHEGGLEGIAAALSVDPRGRHTALGDSLVTAEILARLLQRLREIDIVTLEQALAFQATRRRMLTDMTAAGWRMATAVPPPAQT